MRLRAEIEEMIRGTLTLDFLEGYDAQELLFLCVQKSEKESI